MHDEQFKGEEKSRSLARQILWNPVGIASIVIVVAAVVAIAVWLFPMQQRNVQYKNKLMQSQNKQVEESLGVPGTYRVFASQLGQLYLKLNKDGTFEDHYNDVVARGHYALKGTDLLMTYEDAGGRVTSEKHFKLSNLGIERYDLPTMTVYTKDN